MQGSPAPAAASTSLRWSPTMTLAAASPPAAARVARRWAGSGLRTGKLSPPPTASQKCEQAQRVQELARRRLGLVGADGQAPAVASQQGERVGDAGEGARGLGGMGGVVGQERLDIARIGCAAPSGHRLGHQRRHAVADHAGEFGRGEQGQAAGRHHAVYAREQVRDGVRPACRRGPAAGSGALCRIPSLKLTSACFDTGAPRTATPRL